MSVHLLHFLGRVGSVAERELLALAVEAFSARNDRQDDHPVSCLQVLDFRPNVLDDTDVLVAHDQPFFHGLIQSARIHMQVRATYGAVGDVHNGILRCGDSGLGYLTQLDRFRARPESCLHFLAGVRLVRRGTHWPVGVSETGDTYAVEGRRFTLMLLPL